MKSGLVVLWCMTFGIAGSVLYPSVRDYADARASAEKQLAECRSVAESLHDLALLRAGADYHSAASDASDEAMTETISQTLAEVGLASGVLESFVPDRGSSSAPLVTSHAGEQTDIKIRRERASLILQDITLPRFGVFIDVFLRRRPSWRVTKIDITTDRDAKVTPGEDLPLRAVLSLETVVIDEPQPAHHVPSSGASSR